MTYSNLANCLRFLSVDMVEKANSGHPGQPMGMADVATVLFKNHLTFYAQDPKWQNRDRFVLSSGHGSALLYSLLYLTGYDKPTLDDLKSFRQLHSPCAGHPECDHLSGVETTTGPLGQGLGNAVGMAIAQKKLGQSNKVYVMAGDGCLMEGISHEVCSLAGHLKLNNLIILFDDNQITIDGPTNLSTSEDVLARFASYGFKTFQIDGHNYEAIDNVLTDAKKSDLPVIIACRTLIGKGSPNKQGTSHVHGSPLGKDEIQLTRVALNWTYGPFEIPEDLLNEWRRIGKRCEADYLKSTEQKSVKNIFNGVEDVKKMYHEQKPNKATRVLFQEVLNHYVDQIPNLIGGSADLTPSNNTKVSAQKVITSSNFEGSYIHYGIREHGMGSIMNGLALSGFISYGGTFLVFSDYMRSSIRLSALMKQQVFYIMTHDSIGLGEDGPTHQPVEHLCSLRSMPNLKVFRPADAIEMLECWELALNNKEGPSLFALSRQNIPYLHETLSSENMCQQGAYVLSFEDKNKPLDITLIGTGSEVHLCVNAKKELEQKGKNVRVVSMPCVEIFEALNYDQKQSILGSAHKYIVVEASIGMSLKSALCQYNPIFIGMKGFGASAPASDLYKHFQITVDNIVSCSVE